MYIYPILVPLQGHINYYSSGNTARWRYYTDFRSFYGYPNHHYEIFNDGLSFFFSFFFFFSIVFVAGSLFGTGAYKLVLLDPLSLDPGQIRGN